VSNGRKFGGKTAKIFGELIRKVQDQGWVVTRTNGDHLRWQPPGGGMPIYSASTPRSDNIRAHLRLLKRAGYKA
jgi:hypothetical protein